MQGSAATIGKLRRPRKGPRLRKGRRRAQGKKGETANDAAPTEKNPCQQRQRNAGGRNQTTTGKKRSSEGDATPAGCKKRSHIRRKCGTGMKLPCPIWGVQHHWQEHDARRER